MVSYPILTAALSSPPQHRWRGRLAAALVAVAGVLAVSWTFTKWDLRWGSKPLLSQFPVRAVAVADSLNLSNPVLNDPDFGGYILWMRGDSHPPMIDSRFLGDRAFHALYARAISDSAAQDT